MKKLDYRFTREKRNSRSARAIMGLILCICVLGIAGILMLGVRLKVIMQEYTQVIEEDYKDISYMDKIEKLLFQHESIVFQHMAEEDMGIESQLKSEADVIAEELTTVLVEFGEDMKGREYETDYHNVYTNIQGYFSNVELIFEFSAKGNKETAAFYMNSKIIGFIETVNDTVSGMRVRVAEEMEKADISMKEHMETTKRAEGVHLAILTIFGSTAFVLCGILTWNIVNVDTLADVFNSNYFDDRCRKLVKKKQLSAYVCIMLDIKDFTYLNRKYGSVVGDDILKMYAARLKEELREEELIARHSGDTFLLLVKKENVKALLATLHDIDLEVEAEEETLQLRISSRCGVYPIRDNDRLDDIQNGVNVALTEAKRTGTKDQIWFSEEHYEEMLESKKILEQYKSGMKNEEFLVYYQPKVDAATGRLCGCEALVRWLQNGKIVPPMNFIPVLEREGKVTDLDFYVFEHVCKHIHEWTDKGLQPVRVSSNFSKLHLQNRNLAEDILGIVKKYHVDPQYVEVELTESSGFEDLDTLKAFVQTMKEYGIHTSMDDFGTGYSSLSMLKDVEVDVVKLDKTFLDGINAGDGSKEKMITHLVHMIQDLRRTVVCEGVETKSELEFLQRVSGVVVQGYLFDKPLPQGNFEERLLKPQYEI